jgi:hypothetical protein
MVASAAFNEVSTICQGFYKTQSHQLRSLPPPRFTTRRMVPAARLSRAWMPRMEIEAAYLQRRVVLHCCCRRRPTVSNNYDAGVACVHW